mmetsp:Transcript_63474/g.87268  ORF Transcript_63474/g.87268 Transcript_63474/m.87268 type:complete len:93 (+) Transcript_63474:140-418(+)
MYRNKIHSDDPMAAYMLKKRAAEADKLSKHAGKPARPVYKGPTPKPNRFNIHPGYRWDGRDRGTGWEAKILDHAAHSGVMKNAAYEWSVAEM